MFIIDIDHIQLAAPEGCEAEARKFFHEVLGLEEMEKPEFLRSRGGCWFRVGRVQLHIGVEPGFQPAGKAHPAFSVKQINELFKALEAAGYPCLWDNSIHDVSRFFTRDPWEIAWSLLNRRTSSKREHIFDGNLSVDWAHLLLYFPALFARFLQMNSLASDRD